MPLGKYLLNDLLRFCGENLKTSKLEAVLVIETDNKLRFENHIKTLCRLCNLEIAAFDTLHTSGKYLQLLVCDYSLA